ncbi:MAG: HAMP domain-containing protein [Candidatus Cloacimonadota bacterium]|nr:MAG: HAMP domain-containing protein [Candidatus Cloacimonadota bacterium]
MKRQGSKWQTIKGRMRYFEYRLSIRVKLTLILIVIPLAIMPFVTVSLYYNNMIYNTIQGMEKFSEIARICETISFLTLKIDGNLKNYVVSRDSNYIEEAKEDIVSLREFANDGKGFGYPEDFSLIISNIDRYSFLLDSLIMFVSREEIPHRRIARDLEKYKEKYDNLMSKVLLARTNAERDSLMEQLKKFSQSFDVSKTLFESEQNPKKTRIVTLLEKSKGNIDKQNEKILEKAREHIKGSKEIGEKYASRGARNIWTVLILTILFVVYLIVVLPERIVVPIKRLSNLVKQIEKGDLKVNIKGFPQDEIGELVRHFSRMLIQVRKIDGLKTQKIHESERKFRFLINSIKEGVIILNDELRLLTANKPASEIVGSNAEEMEEKSLESIEPLKGLKTKLEKLFSDGEKIEDFNFKGKDGVQYTVKVWPIRDAGGKSTGAILLFSFQKS